MTLLVGAALTTPHVPLEDDPFAAEPRYEHPESVEKLRVMYEHAARDLAEVQFRPDIETSKADSFDLYLSICTAWSRARAMSLALNWLLLGEIPIFPHSGAPKVDWVEHWFAGPWPAERP
jgi:hypothetical protein